jgi:hypothetical protein
MRPNRQRMSANLKRIVGRAPRNGARPGGSGRVASSEAFTALAGALARTDGVSETYRLGTRRLALRGRLFAMAVEGSLVVRLPRADVARLIDEGIGLSFEPEDTRATREWASIRGSEDLWLALACMAMEFVRRGHRG